MTTPLNYAARTPPRDLFLHRFAAAAVCVVAIITAGYAGYFAFVRGPNFRAMAYDFGISLPFVTRAALEMPWIPMIVALIALLTGILAYVYRRRALLICAFVLTSLSLAATVTAEIAAHWPMDQVLRSIRS